MAETHRPPEPFTLRLRRYDPESGEAALLGRAHDRARAAPLGARGDPPGEGALRRLDRDPLLVPRRDLRLVRRAHQRPARARLPHPPRRGARALRTDGVIEVEPMGNMPVIKDLIVDMDAVHWKKIQSVTPWLLAREPVPEREYLVDREAMVDVTQSMACIQCGACVSDCLAMEVDPDFTGPAALAKAYRFVGDPRDAEHARAPARPRPRTPTASTPARTASSASTPARRTSTRWARSCACGASPAPTSHIEDRNNG